MVEGYQGRPGAGKTLTAVHRAWIAKKRGRKVYANIPLVDERIKVTRRFFFFGQMSVAPGCEQTFGKPWADGMIKSIDEMLRLDNCLVLLDEVHMWLNADDWKSIPFEVRAYLAQQRKENIDIWWTAQSQARVFNVVRELTAILWSCQRYGPVIVMRGIDPESREDYGKRYIIVSPEIYDLYNTRFVVGDGRGAEGRVGTNERYLRREAERRGLLQAEPEPDAPTLHRVEMPDGTVRYLRLAKQRDGAGDLLGDGQRAGLDRGDGSGEAAPAPVEDTPAIETPEWRLLLGMMERDGLMNVRPQQPTPAKPERPDVDPAWAAALQPTGRSRL